MCDWSFRAVSLVCIESLHLAMQFYEIDLPHACAIKQRLVQKVLPDAVKVCQSCADASCMLIGHVMAQHDTTQPVMEVHTYTFRDGFTSFITMGKTES